MVARRWRTKTTQFLPKLPSALETLVVGNWLPRRNVSLSFSALQLAVIAHAGSIARPTRMRSTAHTSLSRAMIRVF